MGPWPCGRGNDAGGAGGEDEPRGSTGPRPCGRGNVARGGRLCGAAGFNGAAALRPWECYPLPILPSRQLFNGALARGRTASERGGRQRDGAVQRARGRGECVRAVVSLQTASYGPAALRPEILFFLRGSGQGHRCWTCGPLVAAVKSFSRGSTPLRGIASMGPRPCGRGNCRGSWSSDLSIRRFNGAAALRPRKSPCRPARSQSTETASMGPRPCGRGNAVERAYDRYEQARFNGCGLAAVEMRL